MWNTFFYTIAKKLCQRYGHKWRYKDYSNYIKATGEKYDFKASRYCKRCGQNSYFYTKWVDEEKSKLDNEGDYYVLRKIRINKVTYT